MGVREYIEEEKIDYFDIKNIQLEINNELYYITLYIRKVEKETYIITFENVTDDIVPFQNLTTKVHQFQYQDEYKSDEIARLNRKVGFYMNVMSQFCHDLKGPMGSMRGVVNLCLEDKNIPDSISNYLQAVVSTSQKMSSMIDSIGDFARADTYVLVNNIRQVDLKEMFDGVNQIYQTKSSQISFSVDYQLLKKMYLIDSNKFYRVLTNFIENSFKYTENGEINVIVKEDSEKILVNIVDTGFGISAEKLSRVLTHSPNRDDIKSAKKKNGHCLGIQISKNLILVMGGKLDIESELGKGTNVCFTLPLSKN